MTVWCTGFPDPNSPSVEPWRPSLLTCACALSRPLSLPLTVWFPQGDTPEGHSISHLCDSDPPLLVRFPLISMATQLSSPTFCVFGPLLSYWFPSLLLLLVTGCTQLVLSSSHFLVPPLIHQQISTSGSDFLLTFSLHFGLSGGPFKKPYS